jgi:hypothetical protein
MGRRRSGLAVLAAIALAAAGCRSPQPRGLEFERGDPGALRVVVAPMNLAVPLASDLEDAVEPVSAELIRYLQAQGVRVAVIWDPDAATLWRDATEAVQAGRDAPPEFAQVAAVFSRALAGQADYDLLVLPSLVFRDARVQGRFAHWDGVRRRIRVRVRSGAPLGTAEPIPDPMASTDRTAGPVTPDWRGRITGLSIHALVLTPEGRGVFQGFGGLDLVHDPVKARGGGPEPPLLHLHSTLLKSSAHVREGIALALDPYLEKSRSR